MATTLGREHILDGLRALITELRASHQVAGIRIVGGAALALRHFDRGTTQDLDSLHIDPGSDDEVIEAAAKVAESRGWDPGWLNFDVEKDFYPGDALTDALTCSTPPDDNGLASTVKVDVVATTAGVTVKSSAGDTAIG